MGFNLKLFFEELEYRVAHGISHMELLEWLKAEKEYAQVCGLLR